MQYKDSEFKSPEFGFGEHTPQKVENSKIEEAQSLETPLPGLKTIKYTEISDQQDSVFTEEMIDTPPSCSDTRN